MIDPVMEIIGRKNGGASVAARIEFSDFNEAMEFNAMIVDFIKRHMDQTPRCAKCEIPMTTATAEGREDGLYCDKCVTEAADGTPLPSNVNPSVGE